MESERVNEVTKADIEAKWIRVQASVDELGDTLTSQLREVVTLINPNEVDEALKVLDGIITALDTFTEFGDDEE